MGPHYGGETSERTDAVAARYEDHYKTHKDQPIPFQQVVSISVALVLIN